MNKLSVILTYLFLSSIAISCVANEEKDARKTALNENAASETSIETVVKLKSLDSMMSEPPLASASEGKKPVDTTKLSQEMVAVSPTKVNELVNAERVSSSEQTDQAPENTKKENEEAPQHTDTDTDTNTNIDTETVDVDLVENNSKLEEETPTDQSSNLAAISHQIWDELLQKYVSASGKVNYAGFQGSEARLDEYLKLISNNPPQSSWAKNEKLAYWINAYNAFTVKLILNHYPVGSIRDINKPWDTDFIKIGDKTYTLNQIEHDIVRPTFKEARIHFALVCAAKSCPPLLNRAFTADKLESQLENRTKSFLNNSAFNEISANQLNVSSLFDWYKEDFIVDGSVVNFINPYVATDVSKGASISYMDYNWSLNN